MKLRDLEIKDAPLMLEWMHDFSVVENLHSNFIDKTIEDCEAFIRKSQNKEESVHLAIVSDENEYMGTVSLKCINRIDDSAEFAITVRKSAMGKGYSWYGMKEIIKLAFERYDLKTVYWCVSSENERAVRFYNNHKCRETMNVPKAVLERYNGINNLKWYSVIKGDCFEL